ncbi:hypothetical protein RND71_005690 [Anisodus tanguticus]|uniref:RNA-binding S4 domain-containing protein n=1 Tax=Anisodus tanguticus TaxID=243964 RepID=A0AAE1SPI5_9SOLA|nr:hypothetical protein RND71_005690 [Anisodus tanguticus]
MELEEIFKMEEFTSRQKSRCLWLKQGDNNTAVFHKMANSHRRFNHIDKLECELTTLLVPSWIKEEGYGRMIAKRRLDELCLERFQQYSRTFIQSWILQGKVLVDGKVVTKAGTQIPDKAVVEIMAEIPKYVCRGGHKLEAAIENLGIHVTGKVALDSGLSTGGFTDCLLQYGASFVYGVDVGYGQVADKIRRDERVSVIERTNLRYLSELPQKVDLVTLDLSFISILLVMPAVVNLMKEEATLVTLIKPQFEARRSQVGGGGIVRDPLVHQEVIEKIINGVQNHGFQCKGWIESPLKGAEGNKEFLACFNRAVISEEVEKQ